MKPQKHAHVLVAETAEKLTNELYDTVMSNNQVLRAWREQHEDLGPAALRAVFVKRFSERAIPAARATLAHMLELPGDDALKESIYEALLLDATLIRGRQESSAPPSRSFK